MREMMEQLGIIFTGKTGSQQIGQCPFCDAEDKFYAAPDGRWDCKASDCSLSGNHFTFIRQYHRLHLDRTTKRHYQNLAKQRGLSYQLLAEHRLAYDRESGQWIIPIANSKGDIVNLATWNTPRHGGRSNVYTLKHLGRQLYGIENLSSTTKQVYIVEGEWDKMAMSYLLDKNRHDPDEVVVLAIPGCNAFPDSWLKYLGGMDVFLYLDNDPQGKEAMAKHASRLLSPDNPHRARSVSYLAWHERYPEKFDVRDMVVKYPDHSKALAQLVKMTQDAGIDVRRKKLSGITCRDWQSLLEVWKSELKMDRYMRDGLLVALAVWASHPFTHVKDPLWMHLVGGPGSGKTAILLNFEELPGTIFRSQLRDKEMVSGMHGGKASLLPHLIGNCLILKDYTEQIRNSEQIGSVHSILRGAFDARTDRGHGTGIQYAQHVKGAFSILSGTTDEIYGVSDVTAGERFLKLQLGSFRMDFETRALLASRPASYEEMIEKEAAESEDRPELRAYTAAFGEYILTQLPNLPDVPSWMHERIVALAKCVTGMRAQVDAKRDELVYRPSQAEQPTRVANQLTRLLRLVSLIKGTSPGRSEYRLIEAIAMHTSYGLGQDIVCQLSRHIPEGDTYPAGQSVDQLWKAFHKVYGRNTIVRKLRDLFLHEIVTYESHKQRRGAPVEQWYLRDSFYEVWQKAGLEDSPVVPFPPRKGTKARREMKRRARKR